MYHILVTGGQGFIGKNLIHELRQRGNKVIPCDVLHSSDPDYVRCDVSKYRHIERILENQDIDYVYHAAAEYGRWNGEDHYENLWLTNCVGTKNILTAQAKYGFKMVFFGSAEVYGDFDGVMKEDVMEKVPIKQMNDYAISKWANELQIRNSALMHNTESVIVRLFNVYGPHEHYSPYRGVVPVFIYRGLSGLPYTVYKGHKRTFEYVDDIARTLANIPDLFNPGEIYNLGSSTQYTIEDLSLLIMRYTGHDKRLIEFKGEESFTTRSKIADCSKAEKDLNHKITISLEEGIKRTVDWFRREYRL